MDEKIKATEELTDDIKESAANAAEKVAEKGEEAFSNMKKAAKKAAKNPSDFLKTLNISETYFTFWFSAFKRAFSSRRRSFSAFNACAKRS